MATIAREQLQRYYDNPSLSDVTICFGEHRIRAHKNILSMASEYFRGAFEGRFAEATAKEMHLHEDYAPAVLVMLKHIYGFPHEFGGYQDIDLTLNTWAVACKYDTPGLLPRVINDVDLVLVGALLPEQKDVPRFVECVRRIYKELPRHDGTLIQRVEMTCESSVEDVIDDPVFKQLLLDVPELSARLVELLLEYKLKYEAEQERKFAEERERERERDNDPFGP